jgi:protein-L-isoaspartate(D-aspartate) O-methyltransferase
MLKQQIENRGVKDPLTLHAMKQVKRHLFVPKHLKWFAYNDTPLPIGHGQTISQPYIVAFMTEAAELKPSDVVLEIGTGSGYQTAVLAEIVEQVYSIEIVRDLGWTARTRLKKLGYENIEVKVDDGYKGWKKYAPFDAIILTAAPSEIPKPLIEQLKVGGRLIAPVGTRWQELIRLRKTKDGITHESLLPVRFVPMTGAAQKRKTY